MAVLPLSRKDTLVPVAQEVLDLLQPIAMCDYDETQSIGRRYRRQDEIGTPLAVTVDFDSLEDRAVTIRDRDTTEQVRVPIAALVDEVQSRLADGLGRTRGASHRSASRLDSILTSEDRHAVHLCLRLTSTARRPCSSRICWAGRAPTWPR